MDATQLTMTDEIALLEEQVRTGDATWRTRARIGRLTRERDRASLGALVKCFENLEFREGDLVRARLKAKANIRDFRDAPAWATVEELDLGRNALEGIELGAFLNACPALQTVHLAYSRAVHTVPCPGIRNLHVDWLAELPQVAERFPSLRSLTAERIADLHAFWSHPFVERLESVTLRTLTWSGGVLRASSGSDLRAFAKHLLTGPHLRRLELSDDVLNDEGELYRLYDALAAARLRGAEVVLVPGEHGSFGVNAYTDAAPWM